MNTSPTAPSSNARLNRNLPTTDGSPDDWLITAAVRESCGGVSDMTIWRWTRTLGFPAPDRILNGRKYWRRSTVAAWKARADVSTKAA